MAKPVVYEIAGSTYRDSSGIENVLSTYFVDPNPSSNDTTPMEDLFAYVELVARPKSRSIIQSQSPGETSYISTGDYARPISFITQTKQNDKLYHTTNYLRIDGMQSHVEGFGITSIDIDTGADYTPKVIIEFFDTKGSSFRDFDDKGGASFSDNPLGMFFRLPYPVFELTVKGFYGKAVTYCLNLMKFNAKFSPNDGGFIIRAEFIGYTFAFLADIPLKHVWAISQTSEGREKIKGMGVIPLSEMLSNFGKLTRITEDLKTSNLEYLRLKYINLAISKLNEIASLVGEKSSENNSLMFTNSIASDIPESDIVFVKDVCILNNAKILEYDEYLRRLSSKISEYNEIIETTLVGYPKITSALPLASKYYSKDTIVNEVVSLVGKNYPNYDTSLITNQSISQKYNLNRGVGNQFYSYLIDYKQIRDEVSQVRDKIFNEKKQQELKTIVELNSIAIDKLQFNPTVENVFTTICANIDAYLELLYEYSMRAASLDLVEERKSNLNNFITDINDVFSSDIHPFPEVVDKNDEKKWIGDLPAINTNAFPEISFVNLLINGLNQIYTDETRANLLNSIEQSISNDNDTHFMCNPMDYGDSTYEGINFANGVEESAFVDPILSVFFSYYTCGFITDPIQIGFLAKIEGESLFNNLSNPTLIQLIANYNNFANSIIDFAEDSGSIVTELIGYKKPNISINSLNLSDESILIRSSDRSRYEQIYLKEVSPSDTITQYSSYRINRLEIGADDRRYNPTYSSNYLLEKDFSYNSFNDIVASRLINNINANPLLSVIPNGVNSETNYSGIMLEQVSNLEFLFGKISNTGDEVVDCGSEGLTNTNGDKEKIYFDSLAALGLNRDLDVFFNLLQSYSGILHVAKIYISFVGGYFYFQEKGGVVLDGFTLSSTIKDSLRDKFVKYFLANTSDVLVNNLRQYRLLKTNYEIDVNHFKYNELVAAYMGIKGAVTEIDTIVIVNSDNISQSRTGSTREMLAQYLNGVQDQFKILAKNNPNSSTIAAPIDNTIIKDPDFKLDTYDSVKAIYDKWLSYGDSKIYNNCSSNVSPNRKLIDMFHFVDRTWNDIGDRAVINPKILMNLSSNNNETMYGFISKILNDSKFLVYFAPSFVTQRTPKDLEDMFSPQPTLENGSTGSSVIAIYTGGNSKHLSVSSSEYKNDGFSFLNQNFPKRFSERKAPNRFSGSPDDRAKYNVSCFLVDYGRENQTHFKAVEVGSEEHYNTNEYLQAYSDLVDRGSSMKRFYKGMDIYNLYQIRSYKATVTGLGNMQIQPMSYFELNIPLFQGVYMITKVSHSIKPNSVQTVFSGYRMPSYNYPLVEEVTSYINLPDDILDLVQVDSVPSDIIQDSDGQDRSFSELPQDVVEQANESDNILFTINIV